MRIILKWLIFGAGLLGAITALVVSLGQPKTVRSAGLSDLPDAATAAAFAQGGCAGCHTIPGIPNAVGQVGPDPITNRYRFMLGKAQIAKISESPFIYSLEEMSLQPLMVTG